MSLSDITSKSIALIDDDKTLSSMVEAVMDDAVYGGMRVHDAALLAVGYIWADLRRKIYCDCDTDPNECVWHDRAVRVWYWTALASHCENVYREEADYCAA